MLELPWGSLQKFSVWLGISGARGVLWDAAALPPPASHLGAPEFSTAFDGRGALRGRYPSADGGSGRCRCCVSAPYLETFSWPAC